MSLLSDRLSETRDLLNGRLGSDLPDWDNNVDVEGNLFRFVSELHTWLSRPAASVAEYETTTDLRDNSLGEMTTISGRIVYPLNMRPQDFDLDDIAHHLARTCRYNGAVSGFLSVAEHCVMVAKLVEDGPEPWFALEALMHDGMEAYIGDIIRPIKHLPEFQPVRDAEERGEKVMAEFFGLAYPMPAVVKAADRQRLYDEIEHLRFNPRANTPATTAKHIFLATFERLSHDRKTIWADKLAELGIAA